MKNILKIIVICVLSIVFTTTFNEDTVEASEKVYREYDFYSELNKFPIKLTNGLTVNKKKVDGQYVPTIEKGSSVIWEGYTIDSSAYSRIGFTVSKNKDTFFYFNHGYRNSDSIELIGVNQQGKLFLQKEFKGDGVRMRATFLNANTIDIATERFNENYSDMWEIFTDDFHSKIYKLYAKGTVEEISYFDKEFADLAKKGQLKGAPGQIKGTFKSLKSHADFKRGSIGSSEMWRWYAMPYASYAFYHSDHTNYESILDKQTIRAIYKDSNLLGTRKKFEPELKKLFGAPIYKRSNEIFVYKAGKNYVGVRYENYFGISNVTVAVIDGEYYKLVKEFGL